MNLIGQRITIRRKQLGMNQTELAELIKSSQKQISRYEKGENEPSSFVLLELAKALETTPNYLLGLTDNANSSVDATDLEMWEIDVIEMLRSTSRDNRERIVKALRSLAGV